MDIHKIRCTVPCQVEDAKSGCHCAEARDEITRLRERTEYWPDNAERDAVIRHQKAEIERLRAALELYRDAVRIDATMEGPRFMGANSSALKRAWDADRAALEGRT